MSEAKKEIKKFNLYVVIIIAVIALGVGFGVGIFYQKNQKTNFRPTNGQFQTGDRNPGVKTTGDSNPGLQNGSPSGQNNASGEVTKFDDTSITIKTVNGGSKLILISSSTAYKQLIDSDKSQLQVGSQITVEGESNTDGSITGKTISVN